MRVFIVTLGTRGDFEPFWALGRELRARGHTVTIGTSPFFAESAADTSLDWVPIGSGTKQELLAVLASLNHIENPVLRPRAFFEQWLLPQLKAGAKEIARTGQACDYFICNLTVPLRSNGRILPGAFVSYDPPHSLEKLAQRANRDKRGRFLELVAMNKPLVDPQAQWGEQFHFTGFWAPPRTAQTLPVPLRRFVESGSAPVVLTTGSMVPLAPQLLVQCFREALRLAGERGVLVSGWLGLPLQNEVDERLLVVDEADYEQLFASAACVIHHGGVGTLAAVLRAGVPSILLPHVGSQQAFGRILQRENLCTGIFDSATLAPDALARAIRTAVDDDSSRNAARRWQSVVRADRGVTHAGELIDAHWARLNEGPASSARLGNPT